MLETSKGSIIIDGLGTFNPDDYFQYMQDQGIIEDKETDVIDNGDGTYEVTTKSGYIFLVELVPTKEKPTDAKIEYLGQAGKIVPIIKKIEISSTASSITAKATDGSEVTANCTVIVKTPTSSRHSRSNSRTK